MDFIEKFKHRLELNKAKEKNAEFKKKYPQSNNSSKTIPRNIEVFGSNTEYVGEIFDAQGNHFAYEKADGSWDTTTPLTAETFVNHKGKVETRVVNSEDKSFEAMKALMDYPRQSE